MHLDNNEAKTSADLNEIVVFSRVVQAGSFTEAARLLGMPKSTVSKKVSDLEARLGTRLLQRTTRRLALTDAGRVYFERAEQIVAQVAEAENAVAELQANPRGLLRVTVPLSFGVLGPVVARFLAKHPSVQVQLVCSDKLVDLVRDGFDMGVRAGPLQDSTLVAKRLGTMNRVLLASPAYLKSRGALTTPEELTSHACISFGAGTAPNLWSLQSPEGERKDVRVQARLTVNDFEMMVDAAREGAGVAWVPDFRAADEIRTRRLVQVLPEWCSVDIPVHAVYPSSRHLSPKVVRFIEALQPAFGGE
jgi:DNA-binding transcriptional LysR family regulator